MRRQAPVNKASLSGTVTLLADTTLTKDLSAIGVTLLEPLEWAIEGGELTRPEGVAEYFSIQCDTMAVLERGQVLMGPMRPGASYAVQGDLSTAVATAAADAIRVRLAPFTRRVIFAYDPVVLAHTPSVDRMPETPARVQRAADAILGHPVLGSFAQADHPLRLPCRHATPEEIYRVHDRERYASFIEGGSPLDGLPSDVYCNGEGSRDAVLASCGMVIDALERVFAKVAEGAFCLIRPPGHHCSRDTPNGFCLVNNVVVATAALQERHPTARVAIIDCDVHHGEGTQSLVEHNANILYYSTHRCDNRTFFPYGHGRPESTGKMQNCINVAFDTSASDRDNAHRVISDFAFHAATKEVLLPALAHFKPDIVVFSCGFDALFGDPVGRQAVTRNAYAALVTAVQQALPLVGSVVVLEGGYNVVAVSDGSQAVFAAQLFGERSIEVLPALVGQMSESQGNAPTWPSVIPQTWQDASIVEKHHEWISETLSATKMKHPNIWKMVPPPP